jgi:hypothetical protein
MVLINYYINIIDLLNLNNIVLLFIVMLLLSILEFLYFCIVRYINRFIVVMGMDCKEWDL